MPDPFCYEGLLFALGSFVAWPQLHSFSIGLEKSPDHIAARKVARYLGTVHHEYVFTVQEGLDAIPEVIYHLETYDVTTVRASTPMYLLSRKIKAIGVKMVLSGEGSDEILGGNCVLLQSIFGNTDFSPKYSFRLSIFPCRSRQQILSSRVCKACKEPAHRRLPSSQQVDRFPIAGVLVFNFNFLGRQWPGALKLACRFSTRRSLK